MIINNSKLSVLGLMMGIAYIGCTGVNGQNTDAANPHSKEFKKYWYSGQAELTRYQLEQARYGEIHQGEAVLIFVTEDFDMQDQVKHERGEGKNVASVLKLNFTKKFITGLYPYSMMASVFTPVDTGKKTQKVTASSQEWCGHTFSQLNHKNNRYEGRLYSYFQQEGDQEFSLDVVTLEDEIWTKIRLDPAALPLGRIKLIPGSLFLRLKHRPFAVEEANASLVPVKDEKLSPDELVSYRIEYTDFVRVLEITFEQAFPHRIVAWEEQSQGDPDGSEVLTTRAIKTHTIKSAYWEKNNRTDAPMRSQLGLVGGNYDH